MQKTKKSSKLLAMLLALMMILTILPMSVMATDSFEAVSISEGEPVTISWTDATTGAVVSADSSGYIPASFVLWVEGTNTVTVDNVQQTAIMENNGNYAYTISTSTSSARTIVATITDSAYSAVGTYTITCPKQNDSAPAGIVGNVTGYLPVGQFATGAMWGSIYSDGTLNDGSTKKFVSGFASPGISLGAAGGYVQMDLSTPIYNRATNPYGVDFVVYGNAFNGNPEAGAVKVYGYTGTNSQGAWYDLAGSLYYDSLSKNNATVSYKKVTTTDSTFTSAGIWYKVNDGNWTKFNTNTAVAWWPETTEGYNAVWGNVDNVSWDQANNTITYSNVSLVKDTDTTNDYQFGYFDVHINGSDYGTAVNPYSITNTQSGGDGFDLAWAVDNTGTPVALTHITKVRLYTAAAMDSTGTAFTVPSIFGETSTEVCGIYVADGTGSGNTEIIPFIADANNEDNVIETTNADSKNVPAGSYILYSDAANVYVNGTMVNAVDGYIFTVSAGSYVQILTQNGTESPYITVLGGV